MRLNLVAPIVTAIVVAGGFLFFYHPESLQRPQPPALPLVTDTAQTFPDSTLPNQDNPSTAANYDECIAEGNRPLPDAPDKCLTKDQHLFIKGVVEQ